MKVKTILVSQPEPKMENSPYARLIDKEKVKVDFRPFIHVEGVEAKSVRQQKIDLSQFTAIILTSRNEGLPISIIEAMREGLAIISTNISGIPELVENKHNGLLIDRSVEQLKEIFNNMDSYNWEDMGENSLKLFEDKFTLDRVFTEYCDIYDSLLK